MPFTEEELKRDYKPILVFKDKVVEAAKRENKILQVTIPLTNPINQDWQLLFAKIAYNRSRDAFVIFKHTFRESIVILNNKNSKQLQYDIIEVFDIVREVNEIHEANFNKEKTQFLSNKNTK